ncbi:MAG: hypothetical protein Q7V00_00995 [Sulfurimicrobium sp.]|nr:hypothetical protein [Sulfurimicrobium sp.]MDP2198009.1 hypothetical protein [Sulfurimicrobium sp.]
MKYKLAALAFFSTLYMSSSVMAADNWEWFPAGKDGWKSDFTFAFQAGSMDVKNIGTGEFKGVEFALNCPWFCAPGGNLRQEFHLGSYKNGNASLTTFEINPHYMVPLSKNWSVGGGPGIGYVHGYIGDKEANMSSFQVTGDIDYNQGNFFFGVGARYQNTRNKEIVPGVKGMDNWLVSAKVGLNF